MASTAKTKAGESGTGAVSAVRRLWNGGFINCVQRESSGSRSRRRSGGRRRTFSRLPSGIKRFPDVHVHVPEWDVPPSAATLGRDEEEGAPAPAPAAAAAPAPPLRKKSSLRFGSKAAPTTATPATGAAAPAAEETTEDAADGVVATTTSLESEGQVPDEETFALPLADLHALNGSAPAAAAAVGPDGRAEAGAQAASAVTASQSVPRLPDIERTQSKVGATRSQSKWWPWSAKRQQTLDTDHDDTIDGGRESTGTEDQYMQTEPSTPGTGRPADMCLEDWLRLFKEPKFKVDEEASSENSDGIFDEQYKQMRKHFRSVLIAEQQRAEAERLEAEDDEYLDEGALDKPDALVLKSIDQAIADYPESGLSSKSSKAPSRVTSAGSMWRSPNRSPRTPPKTPRTPTRSPSRAASRLAARGSTVGGGKGSNSGPNTPQSGRSRSRQHLRGGSMANLELQHAANTWAYLVPRAWSRDRLDQLHKDMEADLAYPAPAEPSEDIAHYQQLMRDRLEALGVENAQKENFSKTADPSKAVKACVKRYHEHCHELEIFHGFTREDAVPEGLDKPEKSALRGYIRALCDDPDMPDVIPKSKRKPAPKKETSMPPLRRLDSAGAIGMRLLRVMRFVRNLPHRARTKTPPSRSGTRPPSRAASRISRGSLLSRASKASAVSQKSAAV